jgi:hypothetical protein
VPRRDGILVETRKAMAFPMPLAAALTGQPNVFGILHP